MKTVTFCPTSLFLLATYTVRTYSNYNHSKTCCTFYYVKRTTQSHVIIGNHGIRTDNHFSCIQSYVRSICYMKLFTNTMHIQSKLKNTRKPSCNYTVVSNTSLGWFNTTGVLLLDGCCTDSGGIAFGMLFQVTGADCTNGELVAERELSESIESFELDALRRIDSSDELDFKLSCFSLSSSLQ